MKRTLLLILVIVLLIIGFYESRNFYCLEDGNCVTVWKLYGVCYIIPGKYYGIIRPSMQYIESPISNSIRIYFSKELPNAIIFQSSEEVKVYNGDKGPFTLCDYEKDTSRFNSILYMPDAGKRIDLKKDVGLMNIDIKEDYAIDTSGKHL